jgi:hypothetical protein
MQSNYIATYYVLIHMAGDLAQAKHVCREFCLRVGLCVTITPTTYIYTGGEEEGFTVRLINYPRLPKEPDEILATARLLAGELRVRLCQHSHTIETPAVTEWVSHRED